MITHFSLVTFLLFAALLFLSCVTDPRQATPLPARVSHFPDKQWQQAMPDSQGFDGQKLTAALNDLPGAVFVTRNGVAIASNGDISASNPTLSIGKSITALVFGTLLEQQKVTLDDPVVGSDNPSPPLATYRQFLSMTSDYGLTPHEPGKHLAYNNEALDFYGKALARDFFPNRSPVEIVQAALWDTLHREDPTKFRGKWGGWGDGFSLSARDLARLGLLVLAQGKWQDRQLIPADFIASLHQCQIAKDATISTSFGTGGLGSGEDTSFHQLRPSKMMPGSYSFGWWTNASRLYPEMPSDTIWASGKGGNYIIVCQSLQIVIAVTNSEDSTPPPPALYMRSVIASLKDHPAAAPSAANHKTVVDIQGDNFLINGQITLKGKSWRGHSVEGLLPNSRMVQGIFDDLNPDTRKNWIYPDGKPFDAARNTAEFLAAMPAWREHGLLAFTINLQGGSPYGYSDKQDWINSAIAPVGALRPAYMQRLEKILDQADQLGMVVILGYFYFGQEPRMQDDQAILQATNNITDWLVERGYRHVLIEIANEADVTRYKHSSVKPDHTGLLFNTVRKRSQGKVQNAIGRLYVATSLGGGSSPTAELVRQMDFILLHGNGVENPGKIEQMVEGVRKLDTYRQQPILFNEDDHFDFDKPDNNFLAATRRHASWGYFDFRNKNEAFEEGYQSVPVDWSINSTRKRGFFGLVHEMTTSASP